MEDKFDYFDLESVLMPNYFNEIAVGLLEETETRGENYLEYENLYGMPS